MTANPIGFSQRQASYVGPSDGLAEWTTSTIAGTIAAVRHEDPKLAYIGGEMQEVVDGAGVTHYNLYMNFAPAQPASEPLNPHNMNNAPVGNIGDPARDNSIGLKEQKF